MKAFKYIFSILSLVLLSIGATCQNGPTQPYISLSWTQGTGGATVTSNCVYRGTAAGVYTLPAIYCSTTPITSYTDNTVVNGNTYHYAVTARAGTNESAYSNDAFATVTLPTAPVLNTPTAAKLKKPSDSNTTNLVADVHWK